MDTQTISRQMYSSHTVPRSHSNTVQSVHCSSHTCLSISMRWWLFLQYEFYRMTCQHLPVHLFGCSQYLVVPVWFKAPKSMMTFHFGHVVIFLSIPPPTPNLWGQLLFVTDSETAGQLESVGWQQRHYKSRKSRGNFPLPLSGLGRLPHLPGM